MAKILSYRGLLTDGGQQRILLSTKKGEVGYRIVKFEVIANKPGAVSQESILKLYKTEQSSIDAIIDFSDTTLIAAALWFNKSSVDFPVSEQIVFDQEIFNQDIYITHSEVDASEACNYYLELEAIKLSDHDAMVTTIQSIRSG